MSQAPAMPMYWDAYLADTTHLTVEEHGAYLLLLAAMWRRNGSVPDDDRDNARILGMTTGRWRKVKARLSMFLTFDNGEISQKKLQKTWEKTQEKIIKNRANGAKGGRPKTNKNNDVAKANGSISVNPNKSIPEPEPEPKPYKKEEDKSSSQKKRGARLPDDWTLPKKWGEWAIAEGWAEASVRTESAKFKDYWISKTGKDATKLDWFATWRNWMRNSRTPKITAIDGGSNVKPSKQAERLSAFISGARGTP